METITNTQALEWMLPEGILEWFDITKGTRSDREIHIVLTEKNRPPLIQKHAGKHVECAGMKDISIEDFPIRSRKTILIFQRRYWRVEGEEKLLKREIPLCAPGTKLEQEFADFLKEGNRNNACTIDDYRTLFPGE